MSAPKPFMKQITFIHSTLSVVRINFCIDRKEFQLFLPCGVCLGAVRIWQLPMRSCICLDLFPKVWHLPPNSVFHCFLRLRSEELLSGLSRQWSSWARIGRICNRLA